MAVDDGAAFPATIRRIASSGAELRDCRDRFGPPSAVWRSGDDALTGFGIAHRAVFAGPSRLADAAAAWRSLAARFEVAAEVEGVRPVAFGAFAFADDSTAESVMLVPRRTIVVRGGDSYRIDIGAALTFHGSGNLVPDYRIGEKSTGTAIAGAQFPPDAYERAVERAVERIRAGELEKVVLARDLAIDAPDFDLAAALDVLTDRYRGAWIFAVDGIFGASPETLATVNGGLATSRVLAGTAPRQVDQGDDDALRAALLTSPKNRFEHALAVDSLLLTLGGAVDDLVIGRPFALGLPNVWHLATDATARVRPGLGALDLVALLHPTAAVAGAPRDAAQAAIRELEPFDRRRYAGPVGWIDTAGDGEWAIALRSAEIEGADRVRAFAGAGVVAASDASQELRETGWKFQPIQEALVPVPARR